MPKQLKFLKPLDKYEKARIAKQVKMENAKKRREEEKKKIQSSTNVGASKTQKNPVIQKVETKNTTIPALNMTSSEGYTRGTAGGEFSGGGRTRGDVSGGGRTRVGSLSNYSDDEISQMYKYAQLESSEYNGLSRLFNPDAKKAYDNYQKLYNENQSRKLKNSYQTMTDRGAYDDVLSYGQAVAGVNARYTPESAQALEESKRALREKGYSDDEILSLGDLADTLAMENRMQEVQDFSDKHQIFGSISSIASNMMKPADLLGKSIEYIQGKPIEKNDYLLGDITSNLREGASNDMGKTGKFAYNVGMGIADSLSSRALTGAASPFVMAAGAAEDSTQNALDRGIAPTDAFKTGLASGAAEAAFEKLELDKLQAFKQVAPKSVKSFFGNIGKQMLNEGVSEGATELANTISDYAINGNNSNFALSVDNYESQGMSHEDALDAALGDALKNVFLNALGGALSGGVMGAGYQAIGALNNRSLNPFEGQDINETVEQPSLNQFEKQNDVQATAETVSQPSLNTFEKNNSIVENVNNAEYNTKKIDGFEELNKNLDRLVGMYKGNENTKNMLGEMKSALNEYLQTGNQDAIDRAVTLASEINDSLVGHSYTRKGSGKNSVNAQNRRATTTYEDGDFINEFMSYGKEMRDTAVSNGTKVIEENTMPTSNSGYVSKVATNTFQNSKLFKDVEANMTVLQEDVKNQKLNVDYKSEMQSLKEAAERLDADMDGEIRRLESNESYSGVETDEAFMLLEKEAKLAAESGDYTQVRKWMRTIVDKGHKMGQGLQAFAKYSRSAEGTLVKAQNYLDQKVESWRKNNPKDAEASKVVAKSILADVESMNNFSRQSGANLPLNQDYVTSMVKDSLNKTRLKGKVNEDAVNYITQPLINGVDEAQLCEDLDVFLTNGVFGLSDEDINTVINLFDKASQYGDFSKERYDIEQQAYALIANKISKASFLDKWDAWRYMSMLGNAKTHLRNVIGNNVFGMVTGVKNSVAAVIESGVDNVNRAMGGEGIQRTKSLLNPMNKSDNALIKAGKKDAVENVYTLLNDGNKWTVANSIEKNKQIFNNKALEKFREFNETMLDKEDFTGLRNKYSTSLAGYIKANGKDASIFDSTNESDIKFLNEARTYAIEQAKIATFHEYNQIASALSTFSQNLKNGNGISKAGYVAMEGLLPFKKTPMNILKQGVQYSPASLVNGVYQAFHAVKTGRYTADQAIDSLAKGLTGTGIMALGYGLSALGLVSGAPDEEKDNYNKLTGKQNYALNIGDKSYTIDWLAPFSLPLFVGVELKKMEDSGEINVGNAFSSIAEPVMEMSMLSGLSDTLENIRYGEKGKALQTIATSVATGYAQQGIPTLLGQVARSVDDTRRSTYTGESGMSNLLTRAVKQTENKIPFLSMNNQPYVDAWGREQKNVGGNFAGRLAYNMLSPGYYSENKSTDVDNYLDGLYEYTKNSGVLPSTASSSITVDGQRIKLSPEQYTEFSKTRGTAAYNLFESFLDKNPDGILSKDAQVEVAKDIYNLASKVGNAGLGYTPENDRLYNIYQDKGASGAIDYLLLDAVSNETYVDSKGNKKSFGSLSKPEALSVVNKLDMSKSDAGYYLYNRADNSTVDKVYNEFQNYGSVYDYYNLDTLSLNDKKNVTENGEPRSFATSSYHYQIDYLDKSGIDRKDQARYISLFHKDDTKRITEFYNLYGDNGMYDLYRFRDEAESDGNTSGTTRSELLPVLKASNLTEQEQADYLYYGVSSTIDEGSRKDKAYKEYGTLGAYYYDDILVNANTDGKGSSPNQEEVEAYLKKCNFTTEQKEYYWKLFFPNAKSTPNF